MSGIIISLIGDLIQLKYSNYNKIIKKIKMSRLIRKAKKKLISCTKINKFTNSYIVSFGLLCKTAKCYGFLKEDPRFSINFFQTKDNIFPPYGLWYDLSSTEIIVDMDNGNYESYIKIKTYMTSEYDNTTPISIECRNKTTENNIEIGEVLKDIGYSKDVPYIAKNEEIDISGHSINFFNLIYNLSIIYIETIIDSVKETYL